MRQHHGAKDVARHAPRHDQQVAPLHQELRPRRESRDEITQPDTTSPEELLQDLKLGNIEELAAADDNSVVSVRILFKDWATAERDRLDAEWTVTYNAIVAELARRELTGG